MVQCIPERENYLNEKQTNGFYTGGQQLQTMQIPQIGAQVQQWILYNKTRLNKQGNFHFNGENGVALEYTHLDSFDKFEKKKH